MCAFTGKQQVEIFLEQNKEITCSAIQLKTKIMNEQYKRQKLAKKRWANLTQQT